MKTAREIAHETIRSVFTGGVWCSYHPKGEAPHSPACDALAVVITVDREETTAALTKELATKVDAINELHVLLADAKRSGAASPALQAAREDWMCGGLEPGATCRRRKYHAGDCSPAGVAALQPAPVAKRVHEAMMNAPHDGQPFRQARAAIAALIALQLSVPAEPRAMRHGQTMTFALNGTMCLDCQKPITATGCIPAEPAAPPAGTGGR